MEPKDKLIFFLKQPAFIIIAGYLYIISTIQLGFNPYDSGIVLTGGMRILNGELPYLDFFTMYAPGQFYLDAILQSISREVLVIRFILSFFQLGILILISKISRNLFDDKYHIYSVLMVALWLGGMELYNRAIITSIFFILLLIYQLLKYDNRNYILIGLVLSLTVFFRHDVGIIALGVFNLFFIYERFKNNQLNLIIIYLWQLVGFIPLIIFSAYLFYNVSPEIVYENLIDIPKNVFPKYRSLPFPNPFETFELLKLIKNILLTFSFYIPFLTLLLYAIKIIKTKKIENFELILILGIVVFLNQMMTRSEIEHALPAVVLSSISFFYLLKETISFKRIILVGFLLFLPNIIAKKIILFKNVLPNIIISNEEAINNLYLSSDYFTNLDKAIEYIEENTIENEKIFVGLDRHDITYVNEAAFYYLTERLPATKYHELHPGVTTNHKNQLNMINDIEKNDVKYIITSNNPDTDEYSPEDGKILDIYINKNFKIERQFGNYRILRKITSQ